MSNLRSILFVSAILILAGCNPQTADPSKVAKSGPSGTTSGTEKAAGSGAGSSTAGTATPAPIKEDPNLGVVKGGQGPEYTLRLDLKEGAKRNYVFTVDTFMDPKGLKPNDPLRKTFPEYSTAKIQGALELTVTSVKDKRFSIRHQAKILTAVGTGAWKSQCDDMLKTPQDPQLFTWDERMHNVNIAKEEYVDPVDNTLNGLLPKGPVKVGSTWEYRPFPQATVNTKVKVVGVENVAGIDTLKLSVDTPAANEGEKSFFTVWLDLKSAMYVKCELHTKGVSRGVISQNDFVQTLKP